MEISSEKKYCLLIVLDSQYYIIESSKLTKEQITNLSKGICYMISSTRYVELQNKKSKLKIELDESVLQLEKSKKDYENANTEHNKRFYKECKTTYKNCYSIYNSFIEKVNETTLKKVILESDCDERSYFHGEIDIQSSYKIETVWVVNPGSIYW